MVGSPWSAWPAELVVCGMLVGCGDALVGSGALVGALVGGAVVGGGVLLAALGAPQPARLKVKARLTIAGASRRYPIIIVSISSLLESMSSIVFDARRGRSV